MLPSEHDVPLVTFAFWQPTIGSQVSVVQTLASLQLSAVPEVHTPSWQVSSPLQTLPSAQVEPFGTGVAWHPMIGSQKSLVQTLESLQLSAVPAVQTPVWQVSSPLQTSPSVHSVPLVKSGFEHTPAVHTSPVHGLPSAQSAFTTHESHPGIGVFEQPVTDEQESVVQALESSQSSDVPDVQKPPWQVSEPLQTLPSPQLVPLRTGLLAQPKAGSHESLVQTFESLQLSGVPEVQDPLWQVSAPLQTSPSRHAVPLTTGVFEQPTTGSQASVVQTFESLQLSGIPDWQTPV